MTDALYLTREAINGYCFRHRLAASDLEDSLKEIAARAKPTGHRTSSGAEVWESSGVKFVVRRGPSGRAMAVSIVPVLEAVRGEPTMREIPESSRESHAIANTAPVISNLSDATATERATAYAVAAHAACDARTALRALRYGVGALRGTRLQSSIALAIEFVNDNKK